MSDDPAPSSPQENYFCLLSNWLSTQIEYLKSEEDLKFNWSNWNWIYQNKSSWNQKDKISDSNIIHPSTVLEIINPLFKFVLLFLQQTVVYAFHCWNIKHSIWIQSLFLLLRRQRILNGLFSSSNTFHQMETVCSKSQSLQVENKGFSQKIGVYLSFQCLEHWDKLETWVKLWCLEYNSPGWRVGSHRDLVQSCRRNVLDH